LTIGPDLSKPKSKSMSAATILFAGTPEFARASLRALVDAGYIPAVVLTQPDRPAGRGKKMTASPVKVYAEAQDIDVWQPATLKDPDVVAKLAQLDPDIIIVAAYGLILPQAVLDIPKHGCLNVHASLLPRWRGAAPIQQSILNGDAETGVCLMQMEAGLDTGPVYASVSTPIAADETAGELQDRLAASGGELLVDKLDAILGGNLDAVQQDEAAATYAGKIRRQDAAIDWDGDAEDIHRRIRAYNPVPGAYFDLDGESVKCWKAEVAEGYEGHSGKILEAGKAGVVVACRSGALRLIELQRPGKKRVTSAEFAAQLNLADKRLG
jgi:methionyl-tRNA formyltransferase